MYQVENNNTNNNTINNNNNNNIVTKGLLKRLEDLEVGGRVETIQTTALLRTARILRSPGDLRRLAVTQTPVKNHRLTLM